VGYPPQEQLQSFLVRMITGFGELTQPDRTSEKALLEQSAKLQLMAGAPSPPPFLSSTRFGTARGTYL